MPDDGQRKKIDKVLVKAFDPSVVTMLPLPQQAAEWSKKVYAREIFGFQKGFVNICVAHFGCMECRLVFEGSETIIGLPVSDIPGPSLKEKRAFLFSATVDQLEPLISKGFSVHHDQTRMVILPSGYIHIYLTDPGVVGMLWSVSSDGIDNLRVARMLQDLTQRFRAMANPSAGHTSFLSFLEH